MTMGNTVWDEAAVQRVSANSSSSPRADCEALKYCVFCCWCPLRALHIRYYFSFVRVINVNLIWLDGWLSSISYFPAQKTKKILL